MIFPFKVLMRTRHAWVQQSAIFFSLFNCRVLNANIARLAVKSSLRNTWPSLCVLLCSFKLTHARNTSARFCGCAPAGLLRFDSARVSFEPQQSQQHWYPRLPFPQYHGRKDYKKAKETNNLTNYKFIKKTYRRSMRKAEYINNHNPRTPDKQLKTVLEIH